MAVSAGQTAQDWCRRATLVVAFCAVAHAPGTQFAALPGGSGQDYTASVATGGMQPQGTTIQFGNPS